MRVCWVLSRWRKGDAMWVAVGRVGCGLVGGDESCGVGVGVRCGEVWLNEESRGCCEGEATNSFEVHPAVSVFTTRVHVYLGQLELGT